MTTSNAIKQTRDLTNGVDVDRIMSMIDEIESDPRYAQFQFRATNQWINGGLNRSRIKDFFCRQRRGHDARSGIHTRCR